MDRIHILGRMEGKKLICSIFVTKRKDEMYAMYYLSLPTCLCRKPFLYIQNTYLAEGFQPSDPIYWLPPSLLQILWYLNPLLTFLLCFYGQSYDRPKFFDYFYDDFFVVRIFQIPLVGKGIENFNGGKLFIGQWEPKEE